MADLSLTTADKVNVGTLTVQQETGVAAEAITAGAPVLYDTNGKYVNGDANGSGLIGCRGIATRTVAAGGALTIVRRGLMTGWTLTGTNNTYGGAIYLSNTAGALSDTAGGTSVLLGTVVPIWGQPLGTAADKGIMFEVTGSGASA